MKKTTFETEAGLKIFEEDSYKEGCLSNTGRACEVDVAFKGATVKEVIDKIKDFFDVSDDCIYLNSCDEKGRIDIGLLETSDSYKATKNDIALWKKGKKKLWSVTYTYYIEKVERTKVKLS